MAAAAAGSQPRNYQTALEYAQVSAKSLAGRTAQYFAGLPQNIKRVDIEHIPCLGGGIIGTTVLRDGTVIITADNGNKQRQFFLISKHGVDAIVEDITANAHEHLQGLTAPDEKFGDFKQYAAPDSRQSGAAVAVAQVAARAAARALPQPSAPPPPYAFIQPHPIATTGTGTGSASAAQPPTFVPPASVALAAAGGGGGAADLYLASSQSGKPIKGGAPSEESGCAACSSGESSCEIM